MVFQHFNLFPHLTVLENCTLAPIWVRKMPRAGGRGDRDAYLERVKIPSRRRSIRASSPAASSSAWRSRARCA
jgi:general L-amino acid transport system ATP-binding protein